MIREKTMSTNNDVLEVVNADGAGDVVFVCEHASNVIPTEFDQLGLSNELIESHIAWDAGAMSVARRLNELFDGVLVAPLISRLVYDCNRPPEAEDAIPFKSEVHVIPGNVELTTGEKKHRVELIYTPFRNALNKTIDLALKKNESSFLVTIHSFVPIYKGNKRDVEIGILHDEDTRLADCILAETKGHSDFVIERNAPYGPEDGVTHTLCQQGLSKGLPNVMIEIRNDLIADVKGVERMAVYLASVLKSVKKNNNLTNMFDQKESH